MPCLAVDANVPASATVVVSVSADARYPTTNVAFTGHDIDQATQNLTAVRRDEAMPTLGTCADEIATVIKLESASGPRKVKLSGAVTDFAGLELTKIAAELSATPEAPATTTVTFRPAEANPGPFYLTGEWQEVGGDLKGSFSLTLGQANARITLDDFETIQYPQPNQPLVTSPEAKHRGEQGLLIKLAKVTRLPANANEEQKKAAEIPQQVLPVGQLLPGRPAKVGFWIKTPAAVQIAMKLHDPGVDARQANWPDNWVVGPVQVAAGPWQYVELPMPGFGKSAQSKKPYGESNGVVDYPLTLDLLQIFGDAEVEIAIDDLEVWTQMEPAGAAAIRAQTDKPTGLLYLNDRINVVIANQWLWSARDFAFNAHLESASGDRRTLVDAKATIAPGAEAILPVKVDALPVGPHRFVAEARIGEQVVATAADTRFIVYQPRGQALGAADLHKLLTDRYALLAELKLTQDLVMVPWHSTDNSPAVEPFPGFWTYDFITPSLSAGKTAGIEMIGTLGFCPLWADPSASWNKKMSAWYGSTTVMPAHDIYWEEYVRRVTDRFSDTVRTWVVWDRPDSPSFNSTPEQYVEHMLDVAHRAANEVDPKIKLVSGAITRENTEKFIVAMAETGADAYLAGIGILPSTSPLSPEDGYMDVMLARAQRVRERERVRAPMWALNLAWPSGSDQYHVSELDQANFVARAYIMCRAGGVDHIILKPDNTEAIAKRDSADLIYPEGNRFGLKPVAITGKVVRAMVDGTTFVREVFLDDRREGLSRAYLFKQSDGKLLLTAWRREGVATLHLPVRPERAIDAYGNAVELRETSPAGGVDATIRGEPFYFLFSSADPVAFTGELERRALTYEDAPESTWKRNFTYRLDVGNAVEEQQARYAVTGEEPASRLDSFYHNDHGRHVVDTGRHFKGEESFELDVTPFQQSDLMLRKRINYGEPNQLLKVYCDDQLVGQWFAFKRDRRYRWRDIEYVIPNAFIAGKSRVKLRFVAQEGSVGSTYCFWAGALNTRTLFASDLSHLVGTSGYGPGVNRDRNILGGPMQFFKQPDKTFDKGIGTNAASSLAESLVVLSLNKQYKTFKATVGIDAATNGQGSVRFKIGDGTKMIYDSGEMTYYSDPKEVEINVSDAIILMLWTDDAGDGSKNDIANWCNARLELK